MEKNHDHVRGQELYAHFTILVLPVKLFKKRAFPLLSRETPYQPRATSILAVTVISAWLKKILVNRLWNQIKSAAYPCKVLRTYRGSLG
jgi:hypothetical protein